MAGWDRFGAPATPAQPGCSGDVAAFCLGTSTGSEEVLEALASRHIRVRKRGRYRGTRMKAHITQGAPAVNFEARTMSDRLVDVIRDMIISGSIAPGQSIRQDALAKQLQVSKIPLREALARLEQYGLVISSPNRGFFVRPLSSAEAEEVFALRLKLEPQATALAAAHASAKEWATARTALEVLDRDTLENRPTVGASNRAFHLALVKPCKQPITYDIIMRLNLMADRYVRKHLEHKVRHARAGAEHHEILDAWIARDVTVVKELVYDHINETLDDLRTELEAAEASHEHSQRRLPTVERSTK